MKNPITILFDEHEIIISAIDIAKRADELLATDEPAYEKTIRELIVFFRVYADQYHHHKEEEILFPEMNKKNELLEEGVIKEMFENHADFRDMIKRIEAFLDKKDYQMAQQQLHTYAEALLDHIAVENDEVFQMTDSLFDYQELEKLYFRFHDCDREIEEHNKSVGKGNKTELIDHLNEIKKNFYTELEK